MNKKKLLMCYHSSEHGGVEKQILDIIEGLSNDFDITVVCPDGPLVIKYLQKGALNHINLKPRFEADLGYVYQIFTLIKKNRFDVVHSHEVLTGSLATFGAWLARCPKRIYHVHTPFSQWQYNTLKKIPALVVNTIANFVVGNIFATDVLALTPEIQKIRIKNEFICKSKIIIIPNGVKLDETKFTEIGRKEIRERYEIDDHDFVIGNISRFTNEKGHKILVDAFYKFLKKSPNPSRYKLFLAGGGALFADIKTQTKNLGIKNQVIFTDKFDDKDKIKILSSFDLFVMPSLAEGFGIVLVEAMATKLPCLVSDLSVFKDVGENTVEFFKKGDSSNLSFMLDKICLDKKLLESMSKASIKQVQQYSMDKFWKNYKKLYLS